MKKIIDSIVPTVDGIIEVRQAAYDDQDNVSYHRWILMPGQNIDDQEQAVKDVCQHIWTPEVVAAFQNKG